MPKAAPSIDSASVPEAPNLARIRAVITAITGGADTVERIVEETDISARHVGYTVRAAQALGFLDDDRSPTPRGRALIETDQESAAERAAFREAIEESAVVRALAPGLLSDKPPTRRA